MSGTTVTGALGTSPGYSIGYLATLATSILSYLTNDVDAVGGTTATAPTITQMQPASPVAGGVAMIQGNGFSPVVGSYASGASSVFFGTATASVIFAAPTEIDVVVPANAPASANLTITTAMGTSKAMAYTLTGGSGQLAAPTGTAGSSSGGGGSNSGGYGRVRLSYNSLNTVSYSNSAGETSAIVGAPTPHYGSLAQSIFSIAGVVQSLGYDTGTAQPTYVSAIPTASLSGGSISYLYSSSPDNSTWSAWTTNLPTVPAQRYIRWQATISGSARLTNLQLVYDY